MLDAEVLVGGVDAVVGQAEAGEDRRDPLGGEHRDHGEGAAEADRGRAPAGGGLHAVGRRDQDRVVGGQDGREGEAQVLDRHLGAGRGGGAQQVVEGGGDGRGVLAAGEAQREGRGGLGRHDRLHRLCSPHQRPWTSSDGEARVRM